MAEEIKELSIAEQAELVRVLVFKALAESLELLTRVESAYLRNEVDAAALDICDVLTRLLRVAYSTALKVEDYLSSEEVSG